jgi:3-oxoadipate enol-lactonase
LRQFTEDNPKNAKEEKVSFVDIGNGRLFHTVNGGGRSLVLLHSAWASRNWWRWQVPVLSKSYKVVTLDLRGHGQSSPLENVYSVGGFTRDLELFLRKIEIEGATLIGWSMGGMVSLQYCMDNPSNVKALVLIATQGHTNDRLKRILIRQYLLERLKLMMDFTAPRKYDRTAQRFPSQSTQWLERQVRDSMSPLAPKEVFDWLINDITTKPRESFFNIIRSVWNWKADDKLKQISVPTLIMVGENDHITPPIFSRRLHQAIPDSKLIIVENAGHFLPMERSEFVNTQILKFLKSISY